ncbi:MAG: type II secretion system F family protein [Candidatus Methylomirabilia bacterium]
MDWAPVIAGLVFLIVMTLVVGVWWVSATRKRIKDRLDYRVRVPTAPDAGILRADPRETDSGLGALAARTPLWRPLTTLTEQAGYDAARANDILLLIATFAVVGGAVAGFRMGAVVWGVLSAPIAGALPYFYLLYKRQGRRRDFEQQFPDSLDMMTRSIRAGYALSGAIQTVGEQMPDPVGQEFRRVFEEIRLGLDPGEALSGLRRRVPTEDTTFFCTAISIQRSAGGNLAEILDRLSEVIRERFKLLQHARALSAQHRWAAICVGLSPVIFAIMFEFMSPGYFQPLLDSPLAPYLIMAGLIVEVIGFFLIWRIAQIKV